MVRETIPISSLSPYFPYLYSQMQVPDTAAPALHRMCSGSMVGSLVNSTASAHLMPLASHCDLDGPLLVATECEYTGGFSWGTMVLAGAGATCSGELVRDRVKSEF